MDIEWISKEECIENIEKFLEAFDKGNMTVDQTAIFFKGLYGAVYQSMELQDDDDAEDFKIELWENMRDDLEEYEVLEYFIEIRDASMNYILILNPDEIKLGTYKEGLSLEEIEAGTHSQTGGKNSTWMDWVPSCQVKIMNGNPNTDAEFFSGECTVKGSTRLGSLPRSWIYDFFAFLERETE